MREPGQVHVGFLWFSCGSGGREGSKFMTKLAVQIKVSLSKTLNPKLLPMAVSQWQPLIGV